MYRHARHAGNPADRWKQHILLAVINDLLTRIPANSPFRYLETHAGAGLHRPRFQHHQRGDGSHYAGSWYRVLKHLNDHQRPARLRLVDRYVDVHRGTRALAQQRCVLEWERGDGYVLERIARFRPHLVFVDPPFWPDPVADWQSSVNLLQALSELSVPVVLWYPIAHGEGDQAALLAGQLRNVRRVWTRFATRSGGLAGCGMLLINGRSGRPDGVRWRW